MLPAPEQPAPVADFGIAGHRPHRVVGEGLDEVADRLGLEARVPVDETRRSLRAARDAGVEGGRLAPVRLADQRDAGQSELLDEVRRAVRRPVVHDHDLDRVVARDDRPDRRLDALLLVVGGDDHRARLASPAAPDAAAAGAPVPGATSAMSSGRATVEDAGQRKAAAKSVAIHCDAWVAHSSARPRHSSPCSGSRYGDCPVSRLTVVKR